MMHIYIYICVCIQCLLMDTYVQAPAEAFVTPRASRRGSPSMSEASSPGTSNSNLNSDKLLAMFKKAADANGIGLLEILQRAQSQAASTSVDGLTHQGLQKKASKALTGGRYSHVHIYINIYLHI